MRLKLIYSFLLLLCINVTAQSRMQHTINSDWQFFKGPVSGADDEVDWQKVNVPHCWNVDDVMDDVPGYYRDTACYKKDIYIPASWKNRDVFLVFDGVAICAEVYVNGHLAASHIGAYTSFNVPISQYLKFSDEGNCKNEIFVQANNSFNVDIPPLSADFTFFGGMYRDVHILALDKVHFRMDELNSEGVFWNTPTVSSESAELKIKGVFENESSKTKKVIVKHIILDKKGKVVLSDKKKYKSAASALVPFNQDYVIAQPHLWSPEDPYLYTIVSQLIVDDVVTDQIENPLAFRWFAFDSESGFSLNGYPYKLVGTSRHQDYKDLGNALSDARHIRDVELLKAMGGNFLRISHYPQDKAVIEACDRLGILTSIEIPLVNRITESEAFFDNSEMMLREMMAQYYNHPSLIIWAYMNEIFLRSPYKKGTPEWDKYLKANNMLFSHLDSLIREEDPYRYTMMVGHGGGSAYAEAGLIDIPMVLGWNIYTGWYEGKITSFGNTIDKRKALSGKTPFIVTEYGADTDNRLHSFEPVRFDKTVEYALTFHQEYLKVFREHECINGMFVWNLSDFSSEGRAETTPHINAKGLMTQDRQAKDTYRFYQANLLKEPYLQIGSKEWNLRSAAALVAGDTVVVQAVNVFSNQEKVELFLNGRSLGQKLCKSGMAHYEVPFENGKNQLLAKLIGVSHDLFDEVTVDFSIIPQDLRNASFPENGINVSLGDRRYFSDDLDDVSWIPDQAYTEGSWGYVGGKAFRISKKHRLSYGTGKDILATDLDPIYATQNEGIEAFRFDVAEGNYRIILHFAELLSDLEHEALAYNLSGEDTKKDDAGVRVFSVAVNGKKIISDLSNQESLVPETAIKYETTIFVKDGETLSVDFIAKKGQTILNGIQLQKIY